MGKIKLRCIQLKDYAVYRGKLLTRGNMSKKETNRKQADRDVEHFLDGQKSAMEFVHEELFQELVEVQETIAKALTILGDAKQFLEQKTRFHALNDFNVLK